MISVIVPMYNVEKYISRCIDSILNNTYKDIELVLINDGSSDNTFNICVEYNSKDNRIKLLSQDHFGVSKARNIGLDNAKGEYICFIDADDSIEKNYFEKLYNFINEYELDWVECACKIYSNSYKYKIQHYFNENIILNKLNNRNDIINHIFYTPYENITKHSTSPCTCIYRKKIINDLRFNEEIIYGEDLLFNYEIVHKINTYGYLNEPIYNYHNDISIASKKYRDNYFEEIKKLFLLIENIRNRYEDELSNEELVHIFNKFLSMLTLHTFLKNDKNERIKDYELIEDMLNINEIKDLFNDIDVNLCNNLLYKIIIYLYKKKKYELLYCLFRLKKIIIK